jgi:hypothetical protein
MRGSSFEGHHWTKYRIRLSRLEHNISLCQEPSASGNTVCFRILAGLAASDRIAFKSAWIRPHPPRQMSFYELICAQMRAECASMRFDAGQCNCICPHPDGLQRESVILNFVLHTSAVL